MENIDYDTLKNSMCEIFTNHGHICPHVARYYDANVDKMTCGKHKEVCRRLYSEYKNACKDTRCVSSMSKREINDIKKVLEECVTRRVSFTHSCCDNKIDRGHAYMLYRLNNRIEQCNEILETRKQDKKRN